MAEGEGEFTQKEGDTKETDSILVQGYFHENYLEFESIPFDQYHCFILKDVLSFISTNWNKGIEWKWW